MPGSRARFNYNCETSTTLSLLWESEIINVKQLGCHEFAFHKPHNVSKQCYLGFIQPEGGVIAYTDPDPSTTVTILDWQGGHQTDAPRAYSIQLDIDTCGDFVWTV